MDTEKHLELQKKINQGLSPNDEGPYYHHSWWESYKGSVKGKTGGIVIGAVVGAIMGGIVAAAVGIIAGTAALGAGGMLGVIGAFAAGGSLFGAHEFGDIGKVSGAVAASQEQAESRMKTYEDGKFSEIKQELAEIKSMIKGDKPAAKGITPESAAAAESEDNYRTTHYAKLHTPLKNRLAFWKVVAIGLVVGVAAGALLAYGGIAGHILSGLVGAEGALSQMGIYAASMTTMGALGASFGINRDIFRKIFDQTDLWFKGFLSHDKVREDQINAGQDLQKAKEAAKSNNAVATVSVPESAIDYPTSSTYHRDRVLAAAEKALQSFDHTRATPQ